MDYSNLVQAVLADDKKEVNRILKKIQPILLNYLLAEMNARLQDAQDCVQDAIFSVLNYIKQEKIRKPDKILSFFYTTTRHRYYKLCNRRKEIPYSTLENRTTQPSNQYTLLVEKEERKWFKLCINKLSAKHRNYILYWFKHPDNQAAQTAHYFDISVSNAWTRKHRIQNALRKCMKKFLPAGQSGSSSLRKHFKQIVHKVAEPDPKESDT